MEVHEKNIKELQKYIDSLNDKIAELQSQLKERESILLKIKSIVGKITYSSLSQLKEVRVLLWGNIELEKIRTSKQTKDES